jgi:hypothetical protein
VLGLREDGRLPVDLGPGVDQVGRVELVAAVVALVAARAGVPADRAGDLIPATLVIGLGYLFLPLDLFIVQLVAMSISFYVHLYFDKHYHVAGSWLGRFAWFRRKQQLHFLHHRHADCNFAVVDNFWDWLLGTYRRVDADRET